MNNLIESDIKPESPNERMRVLASGECLFQIDGKFYYHEVDKSHLQDFFKAVLIKVEE